MLPDLAPDDIENRNLVLEPSRRIEVQPQFTEVGEDKIIGSTQWSGDGRR